MVQRGLYFFLLLTFVLKHYSLLAEKVFKELSSSYVVADVKRCCAERGELDLSIVQGTGTGCCLAVF